MPVTVGDTVQYSCFNYIFDVDYRMIATKLSNYDGFVSISRTILELLPVYLQCWSWSLLLTAAY